MKRDFNALEATGFQLDFQTLAGYLKDAVEETISDGQDPTQDPAVLLLGSFVAFHVHADINSAQGYERLVDACQDRIENRSIQ